MNLRINDDYVTKMGEYLKQGYEDMDEFMYEYRCIMNDVLEKGIAEGATHEALSVFIDLVKSSSEQRDSAFTSTGAQYHMNCNEFLENIKKADYGLYGS